LIEQWVREVAREEIALALAEARQPDDDPWLTSDQAAARLGVAVATIYDYVNSGKLPRHGERRSRLRWRRSELDAFAAGRS
jgi:excisionase family DNA binding protein